MQVLLPFNEWDFKQTCGYHSRGNTQASFNATTYGPEIQGGEERDALYPKRLIRTSPLQAGFGSCALWRWVAGVFSKPVGLSSCPGEGHRGHKSHGKDKVHDSWSQAILGTSHFTVQVEWGPEFYYKQPEIQSSGCPSTKYFIIPLKI